MTKKSVRNSASKYGKSKIPTLLVYGGRKMHAETFLNFAVR
jgi:hypothetical protein